MNKSDNSSFDSKVDQAIDHFYDLLLQSEDLFHIINMGMKWIASCLDRDGAAVYLINPSLGFNSEWIKYNVPDIWNLQFDNPSSQLFNDAINVYGSQEPIGENPLLQVAAILPMASHGKTIGVIIFRGRGLNQNELAFAKKLVTAFSRSLLAQVHVSTSWREEREKAILQMISLSVNESIKDPDQTLYNLVKGIRSHFNAEYLFFLLIDQEIPNLIIKKLLNTRDEWVYQSSQHICPDLLDRATEHHTSNDVDYLSINNEALYEILDYPIISIRNLMHSHITAKNGKLLGSMILINLHNPIGLNGKEILLQYSSLLADVMENLNYLQSMKIALAQLETKRVEITNSRDILRELFDNIPISMYIIDNSYTILAANEACAARSSLSPNFLVGKTCYEALAGRNSPCPACRVSETLTQGKNTTRFWREWTTSETHIEWEISTHPIFDEMHVPIHAIIQEVDITEKRNLEANLIQSEKLATVGQLAAGIAHEINNPLSAIIANAQILLQETKNDDPEKIESLKLIETAGIRASHVVRNLLGISHKDNLDFEPTDINKTIQNALMLIHHELHTLPITVELDLCSSMPPVLAQQDHLQGVWINLVINAIDAIMSTNRQDGIIQIKSSFTETEYQITISDNGKGIEPEKIQKLFEPFYTTKAVGHGTGLGLSVCLRTIKEHEGNISVESQLGQGTCFTITIPSRKLESDYYEDIPD
jgi:two-component system NtrC family sensor kinase